MELSQSSAVLLTSAVFLLAHIWALRCSIPRNTGEVEVLQHFVQIEHVLMVLFQAEKDQA